MTHKDGPQEHTLPGRHPSHTTEWARATHNIHKRAKKKLGTKADTQIVRHDDLQQN